MSLMRVLLLLLLAGLGGCGPGVVALTPVDVVTVPVLGRGVTDIANSAASGRDCSVVRLDAGQTYCASRSDLTRPQPICTRTIGVVNCWANPALVPQRQQDVEQTPPPTLDQLRYRAAPWPKALFF